MHYYPLKPLTDLKPLFWDDEDWTELKSTEGLNVYEEGDKVVVEASVPGIKADQVKVTYEDGVLRVSASSKDEKSRKEGKKIIHQWNKVSVFEYTTYLPRPIDEKKLDAQLKDGVLTISAPISEAAKAKEITVKSG